MVKVVNFMFVNFYHNEKNFKLNIAKNIPMMNEWFYILYGN